MATEDFSPMQTISKLSCGVCSIFALIPHEHSLPAAAHVDVQRQCQTNQIRPLRRIVSLL